MVNNNIAIPVKIGGRKGRNYFSNIKVYACYFNFLPYLCSPFFVRALFPASDGGVAQLVRASDS